MNTREIQNKKQRILIYLLVLIPFLYFLYIMVYPLVLQPDQVEGNRKSEICRAGEL